MGKLLLVDGNSMIFRAYYATVYGRPMTTSTGLPTNAIFGFNTMISKAIELIDPDYMLVAFDTGKKTFRHELYPDYKGGRKETPKDLIAQFPLVREMCQALGITYYEEEGMEADDIIGSSATLFKDQKISILTSDKDMLQLVDENTTVWLMQKGLTELSEMNPETLYERFHLTGPQIIDLKGLMGDSSDNIPGIPGVGEKTAVKFLQQYQSVENLYEHVDEIKGKMHDKIVENKDLAFLSKQLATICRTMNLNLSLSDLTIRNDYQRRYDFYKKYEMNSFLSKLKAPDLLDSLEISTEEKKKYKFHTISNIEADFLNQSLLLFLDTDLENYKYACIYGFVLTNGVKSYYLEYADAMEDGVFMDYLSSKNRKIVYDAKRVLHLCDVNGIPIQGISDDIRLMAFLIDNFVSDYAKLAEKYSLWSDQMEDIYGKAGKMKLPELDRQVENACCKAQDLMYLYSDLNKEIDRLDIRYLYKEIELPLTEVLYDMEKQGIRVEKQTLNDISERMKTLLDDLTKKIYAAADEEFNINSTKQLAEILFDKLKLPANKKRSTAVDVLEKLAGKHEIIAYLLEYRKYSKLYSTYAEGLKKYIDTDSRIHTTFDQFGTNTGRLSSLDPNLQNISVRSEEGAEIRTAFVPEANCVLVSCDYSQIELRILAHMANEENLIRAFNSGIDIHTATTMAIYNIPKEEVTPDKRRNAKAVNFGIVYGISEHGLSEQLDISYQEAKEFIEKYYQTYPGIKDYTSSIVDDCQNRGYAITLFNRRRYIPEINDKNYMVREFGKRAAMNAPVQGSAADLIKIAMLRIYRRLEAEKMQSKIILQIHDEVVLNVLKEELDQVSKIIIEEMESAVKLSVPLVANIAIGNNWYEAK